MKFSGTLSVAALVLAATSQVSIGQTVIRITGAQGLRAAVHKGIGNILKPGYSVGYQGTALPTAAQAVFSGTTQIGDFPVIIKTSYGTSTAGMRTMAQNLTVSTWLKPVTGTISGLNSGDIYDAPVTADATVSGEFQATTRFTTPTLTDNIIGVFPYVWVRNAGSPSSLSNINSTLAQTMFQNGQTSLAQFTGLPADHTTNVTLIGRDEGASSREALFAESGFGIYSAPLQYRLTITGTAGPTGTVTGYTPYPASVVDGTSFPEGHSGYPTFSSMVAALNTPGSLAATGGWVIAYSSIIDALAANPGVTATGTSTVSAGGVSSVAVTNGGSNYNGNPLVTISGGGGTGATAKATVVNGVITAITVTNAGSGYATAPAITFSGGALMSWNGASYSTTAVEQGQYTYWSYAHLMHRSGYTGTGKTVINQLVKQLHDVDIVEGGNSLLGAMKVSRSGDGTPVVWGNPYE